MMDLYSYIKIIHTVSAAFLFSTSALLFSYCLWNYLKKDLIGLSHALTITLKVNVSIVAGCGILQLITGFTLIDLRAMQFTTDWIASILSAYGIAILCWLCGIHLLGQCQQSLATAHQHAAVSFAQIQKPFVTWAGLCSIGIICMMLVYNFMVIPAW